MNVLMKALSAFESIAYALMIAVVAALATIALLTTAVFKPADGASSPTVLAEQMDMSFGVTPMLAAGLLLFAVIIIVLGAAVARLDERRRLAALLGYVCVVQVLWIGALASTNPQYPDSVMLSRGAAELVSGNTAAFAPDYCAPEGALGYQPSCVEQDQMAKGNLFNYLSWYPFQSGAMLWFALAYRAFGTQNFTAFQYVNAAAVTILVAVLHRFATLMGLERKGVAMFQLLVAVCFPLLMFSAFVYTNAVGFMFTLLSALALVEAVRAPRPRNRALLLTGSFVCGAVGVMVKNTFNILVLAMLIMLVFGALRARRWRMLVAGAIGYPLVLRSTILPVLTLEHLTGQSFGRGMPTLSWIAMGLRHKEGVLPGWWQTDALNAYLHNGGDYAAQQSAAVDSIHASLSSFVADPSSAFGFFMDKLSTEWAEPTFETVLYSGLSIPAHEGNGISRLLLAGPGRGLINMYGDVMQSIVYLFALVAVIGILVGFVGRRSVRPGNEASLLLTVGFLGGFCCYLLWEAKSIYTLPFYLLLLPFAARGLEMTASAVARRLPPARRNGNGRHTAGE